MVPSPLTQLPERIALYAIASSPPPFVVHASNPVQAVNVER